MPVVDLSLEGKVALITGGSKGIGRSTALAYAEHGADVAIAARGQEALEATVKEIEARGRRALGVVTDVGSQADLEKLYGQTVKELGGVDILVNNAAQIEFGEIADVTAESFERLMRINLFSALRLSQLCRQSMQQRGGGVVINVASDEFLRPSVGVGAYPMTKIGLVLLTKQLAQEWGADKIRAVCIVPGLVRTEIAQEAVDLIEGSPETVLNPLGNRVGEPEEIAGFMLIAASPAGGYLNGGHIIVDGGTQSLAPVKVV